MEKLAYYCGSAIAKKQKIRFEAFDLTFDLRN